MALILAPMNDTSGDPTPGVIALLVSQRACGRRDDGSGGRRRLGDVSAETFRLDDHARARQSPAQLITEVRQRSV
jgi:hypothetical protein